MSAARDHSTPSKRQQEIIDRTLELVRERGLGGLTTKKIAERVGFTEAALFRHFPSKRALLLGLMDRLEEMLLAPIRGIAKDPTLAIPERLERIVRHHTSVVLEHNSLPILLLAEASASGDDKLVARMRLIFQGYTNVLEQLVRDGQKGGELITDLAPDCMATLLLGAPAALAIRHRLAHDAEAEDRFRDNLIPFLRKTIGGGDAP